MHIVSVFLAWAASWRIPRLFPHASSAPQTPPGMAESEGTPNVERFAWPAFVEASTDAVVVHDRAGVVVAWNGGAARIFGYPPEEAIGQSVGALLPEWEEAAEEEGALRSVWAGRAAPPIRVIHSGTDGRPVHLSVALFPIRDEEGAVISACGIARDTTERQRAEDALRVRTAQLQAAQELAEMGTWVWTPRTNAIAWSPQMYRIAGEDPGSSDLSFSTFQQRVHPDDRRHFEAVIGRTLQDHRPLQLEFRIVQPKGEVRHLMTRGEVDLDADGNLHQVVGSALDVTEQKRVEVRLVRAIEEAQSARKARSEFLANMSHEIRTPMNGVLGMIELISYTRLDPEQTELLETARQSAEALMRILEDVLDFSTMEAGTLELESMPFDALQVATSATESFAARAHSKGLELIIDADLDPELAHVEGDPGRLGQILEHLVGNAIKFTREGEVVVRITAGEIAEDRVVLHLSVQDTGIGIAKDRQEAIFEEFSQVDSSATRPYEGTGLGLTISAGLAALMGGRIWVEGAPGVGSTFHLAVPFRRGAAPEPPRDAIGPLADGKRLLVVDDNETYRGILTKQLDAWGFRVATLEDGQAAVEAWREAERKGDPFALAIIDRGMPGMDGFALAEELAKTSSPILVMLSSADSQADRSRARAAGIHRYLVKPVEQSRLYDNLVELLHPDATSEMEDPGSVEPDEKEPRALPRLRVLLVEDNAVNRTFAQLLLEKRGHQVTVAEDGSQAVSQAFLDHYDVILMDVQMPVMDGLEATAEIRRREREEGRAPVTIVALTARAMEGDRERCIESGMDGYLSKPLRPDALDAELLRAIPESAATPAPEPEDGPSILDREALLQMVGGDQTLVGELIEIFTGSLPKMLAALQDAKAAGDRVRLRAAAHHLTGSAATLRADRVALTARKLEELCRMEETVEDAAVDQAYDLALTEVQAFRNLMETRETET